MDDLQRFVVGFGIVAVVFALVLLGWAGSVSTAGDSLDGNTRDDGRYQRKSINANEDAFDFAALSFTGNTVSGGVALAA